MNAEINKQYLNIYAIMQMPQDNGYAEGEWEKHGSNMNSLKLLNKNVPLCVSLDIYMLCSLNIMKYFLTFKKILALESDLLMLCMNKRND